MFNALFPLKGTICSSTQSISSMGMVLKLLRSQDHRGLILNSLSYSGKPTATWSLLSFDCLPAAQGHDTCHTIYSGACAAPMYVSVGSAIHRHIEGYTFNGSLGSTWTEYRLVCFAIFFSKASLPWRPWKYLIGFDGNWKNSFPPFYHFSFLALSTNGGASNSVSFKMKTWIKSHKGLITVLKLHSVFHTVAPSISLKNAWKSHVTWV